MTLDYFERIRHIILLMHQTGYKLREHKRIFFANH